MDRHWTDRPVRGQDDISIVSITKEQAMASAGVRRIFGIIAAAMLTASLAACAHAAPATAPVERNPIDLRRTTLIVRDMDASLALYRDALGMTIDYDAQLTSPRLERAGGDGVNRSRLVLLKANDGFIGMLGLWQFLDGPKAPPPAAKPAFAPGEIVLLFNATDLETRFPMAAAVPGVVVLSAPAPRRYPGRDGGAPIDVTVSMLRDPDGHIVELNHLTSGQPAR
jgi:catechol 2,3-dioxygenase-like lactoylglutathione lyase family enzyme